MLKRMKVMAVLMVASVMLASAMVQATVPTAWHTRIAGGNMGSAPTHLLPQPAGDDNGC